MSNIAITFDTPPLKKHRKVLLILAIVNITNKNLFAQVKIKNDGKKCEICSQLTIKTPERKTPFSSVSIVNSEQVNVSWVSAYISIFTGIMEL